MEEFGRKRRDQHPSVTLTASKETVACKFGILLEEFNNNVVERLGLCRVIPVARPRVTVGEACRCRMFQVQNVCWDLVPGVWVQKDRRNAGGVVLWCDETPVVEGERSIFSKQTN